jgi:hypothetical protein
LFESVSGSVRAYIAHVDGLLAAGQSLFAASPGSTTLSETGQQSIPTPPPKNGLSLGGRHTRRLPTELAHSDGAGRRHRQSAHCRIVENPLQILL